MFTVSSAAAGPHAKAVRTCGKAKAIDPEALHHGVLSEKGVVAPIISRLISQGLAVRNNSRHFTTACRGHVVARGMRPYATAYNGTRNELRIDFVGWVRRSRNPPTGLTARQYLDGLRCAVLTYPTHHRRLRFANPRYAAPCNSSWGHKQRQMRHQTRTTKPSLRKPRISAHFARNDDVVYDQSKDLIEAISGYAASHVKIVSNFERIHHHRTR